MRTRIAQYQRIIAEVLSSMYQKEKEKKKKEERITIERVTLGINRKTADLELCVAGAIEQRDGTRREESYNISVALWNYSKTVPENIDQETYEEVMSKERDTLYTMYCRAHTILSDREPITIRRKDVSQEKRKVESIKYHPALEQLRNYQATIYAKMLTLQSIKESQRGKEGGELSEVVRAAEARPSVDA